MSVLISIAANLFVLFLMLYSLGKISQKVENLEKSIIEIKNNDF